MSFVRFPPPFFPGTSVNYLRQPFGPPPMRTCHPQSPLPDFGRPPYPRPPQSGPCPFAPPPIINCQQPPHPPPLNAHSFCHPPNFSQPPPFQGPQPNAHRPSGNKLPHSGVGNSQLCQPGLQTSYGPASSPAGMPVFDGRHPPYPSSSPRLPCWRPDEGHSSSPQFQTTSQRPKQSMNGSSPRFRGNCIEQRPNWRPPICAWRSEIPQSGSWRHQKVNGPSHSFNKQPNKKQKPKNKLDKPEKKHLFYCDSCDRGYNDEEKYKEHTSGHVQCWVKGCLYIAAPKLVQRHHEFQHRTGLAKRIWISNSQEEIEKWRAERKRNFPSAENIERKKKEAAERRARGDILKNKYFGKMRGRGQFQAIGVRDGVQFSSGQTVGVNNNIQPQDCADDKPHNPMQPLEEPLNVPSTADVHESDGHLECDPPEKMKPAQGNKRHISEKKSTLPRKKSRSCALRGGDEQFKKSTLLEKLLAADIRHERNVILQCIRFLVQHYNLRQNLGKDRASSCPNALVGETQRLSNSSQSRIEEKTTDNSVPIANADESYVLDSLSMEPVADNPHKSHDSFSCLKKMVLKDKYNQSDTVNSSPALLDSLVENGAVDYPVRVQPSNSVSDGESQYLVPSGDRNCSVSSFDHCSDVAVDSSNVQQSAEKSASKSFASGSDNADSGDLDSGIGSPVGTVKVATDLVPDEFSGEL